MFGTELSCEFKRDLGLVVFGVGGALKDATTGSAASDAATSGRSRPISRFSSG